MEFFLQDIYRSDLIDNEKLAEIDKNEALTKASKYLRSVHDKHGAVGEVLPSDIIFKKNRFGELDEVILNIPDIIFNPKKEIGDREKKATDILDFIVSMGAEEFRVSNDKASVKNTMKLILDSYNDNYIISLVRSYIKRGRLTLTGDKNSKSVNIPENTFTTKSRGLFTKHNEARIVNHSELETVLKDTAMDVCNEFLKSGDN